MRNLLYILILITFITGCKKDITEEPYPTDPLGIANRWVLDSMRRYYYWADEIPGNNDYSLSTDLFFKKLLSTHDRFSWISNGQDIAAPSNSYFTYGFHYALVEVAGLPGLLGVTTLINKDGAADLSGLQRGDCFIQVNGMPVNSSTIETVNQQLKTGQELKLTPARLENNTWVSLPDITLTARYSPENPVHYTRSFSSAGIITGYLFYNSFDEKYDPQLLQAIEKLKQANVKELILDLRYNAGGSVASSAKLAALLAGKLSANETYAIYQGNQHEGRKVRSLQAVLNTSSNNAGMQYPALQPLCLNLNRVFVLTTKATVSAAELVVNNLKPFITVIQIGETTAGKDEASFLIEDYRIPRQVNWKMQPTIYKLFNKNSQGNYATGIIPQYQVEELASLPLPGIGDMDDPLLYKALGLIYGNDLPGGFINLRALQPSVPVKVRHHSATEQAACVPFVIENP